MKLIGMQIGSKTGKEYFYEGSPRSEAPSGFLYRPPASYKATPFNVMSGAMGKERTVKEPERVVLGYKVWGFRGQAVERLRRVTPEYEGALKEMDEKIADLQRYRKELVAEAYRYGEPVKASEARTWVKPKEVRADEPAK